MKKEKPGTDLERMTVLCRTFPSLDGADGVDPFDPMLLDTRLGSASTPLQEAHTVEFVLSLWGRCPNEFNALSALREWDRFHRESFIAWAKDPWWPK